MPIKFFTSKSERAQQRPFQVRAWEWLIECFGEKQASDSNERVCRFIEEALEVAQAARISEAKVHEILRRVYEKPGDPLPRELGDAAFTLALLCHHHKLNMEDVMENALRVAYGKMELIREKNKVKIR